MKYLKVTAILLGIGLLLQVYGYINLMVSYKYEVDLMETNINTDENISTQERDQKLYQIDHRKTEILKQQKIVIFLFWLFLIGLVVILYFLFLRNKRV